MEIVVGIVCICLGLFLLGIFIQKLVNKAKFKEMKAVELAAGTDALTGLGNRYLFNKTLPLKLKEKDKPFALCFLDLDDFKHINDNMGHDAGDELLIMLGKRLTEGVSNDGKVYRLGGDEYAILIEGVKTQADAEVIVKRIQENVVKPVILRGNVINLEYSLGIAMFPKDTTNSVELVNFADTAMYHVKASGKSNYYFHNLGLYAKTENKKKMEQELKEAVENGEFSVEYQPRVNLQEPDVIWFETFLYWNHPTIGKLKAGYFLKDAENIGLIIPIDEIIIKDAIERLRQLKNAGYNNINIAVNLSLRHFQRNDFVESLCNLLSSKDFKEGSIMLQITDSIDMGRIESYKTMFEKVKKLGVGLSVSNFEIKYEAMDMFKRLKFDEIKISAEYVASNSIFKPQVLSNILALSKELDMKVVVTKVDDKSILEKLVKERNVDMLQGNYLHSMIGANDLIAYTMDVTEKKKAAKKRI